MDASAHVEARFEPQVARLGRGDQVIEDPLVTASWNAPWSRYDQM